MEGMGYMGDVWEQTRARRDIRRHKGMHNFIIAKYQIEMVVDLLNLMLLGQLISTEIVSEDWVHAIKNYQ